MQAKSAELAANEGKLQSGAKALTTLHQRLTEGQEQFVAVSAELKTTKAALTTKDAELQQAADTQVAWHFVGSPAMSSIPALSHQHVTEALCACDACSSQSATHSTALCRLANVSVVGDMCRLQRSLWQCSHPAW